MSMEIGSINNVASIRYAVKTGQEKAQETEKLQNTKKSQKDVVSIPKDEYISGEEEDTAPIGLYRFGKEKNGNPQIVFDGPEKRKGSDKKNPPQINPENPENKAEECTTNTDKVDREIKELKEEKKQFEVQLRTASGDDKKTEELRKKIAMIENELAQKDNDTYRRQHAVIS